MNQRDDEQRLLPILEGLLHLPESNMKLALTGAADLVASAMNAEKVDAFVYDPERTSLVAVGASTQPLSALQRREGLDVLALSNGGRVVEVFKKGKGFLGGRLRADTEELRGMRDVLKIESMIAVPLEIGDRTRGVLAATSRQADQWGLPDLNLIEILARWIGILMHRVELVSAIRRSAVAQGRRAVADDLVTLVAHELRNYLSPIDMRLGLMAERAEHDGRTRDCDDFARVQKGLRRLTALTSDLLDVARMDHGLLELDPERTDITALVEDVAGGLSTPEVEIELKAYDKPSVNVDTKRMRQCLENVLSNAVKHSLPGHSVRVSVSSQARENGEWAVVEIRDHGPGISAELLPHVFERFAKGKRAKGDGLGLGLYLAKEIAHAHHGDLKVSSVLGEGATFTLELPELRSERRS